MREAVSDFSTAPSGIGPYLDLAGEATESSKPALFPPNPDRLADDKKTLSCEREPSHYWAS